MPISFHADPPSSLYTKEWRDDARIATTVNAETFAQRCIGLARGLRHCRPKDTVKWIQSDLATMGVSAGAGTVKGWISEHAPQWPSGRHLDGILRAYGLPWFIEFVYPDDPAAELIKTRWELSTLEAEILRLMERLDRLKD